MEPIRILMLFTILNRGGAETMVMNYYRKIDRTIVQFDFIVHRQERGAYEDEIDSLGGRIYRFMPLSPLTVNQYKKQISKFFDQHPEYKIIHGQCSESGYYIYKEASRRGVPYIIAHAHSSHVPFDLKLPIRTWLKYKMRPYITIKFACGKEAAIWLFGKWSVKNTIILRNAIDTSKYLFDKCIYESVRQKLVISQNAFVVCHVGSFVKSKNHKFIIEVFSKIVEKHPNSILLLVGSGLLQEQIQKIVRKYGLGEKIKFLGSRGDVNDILRCSDVFLFPSIHEGLPVSLIEAQCSGLPCYISDRIPKEVAITDLIHAFSLEEAPQVWAEKILEKKYFKNRREYPNIVSKAGYDIKKNAEWLQNYYLSLK